MSVYNNEHYLKDSIESILNQTYGDFEFLIANDCSLDNSMKVLDSYAKLDDRIRIYNNSENLGLTKTLNKLIKESKGQYIARMDGDDISIPERFEQQMKILKSHPDIGLIFSDIEYMDFEGNLLCRAWTPQLQKILSLLDCINYIPHPTVILKKEVFEKYGYYNEKYITGQDTNLWLRLRGRVNFYHLKEILLRYRLNPNSVSDKRKDKRYFNIANRFIINNHKSEAYKYFGYLSLYERCFLQLKMILPFTLYKFIMHNYKSLIAKSR